MKKRENAVRLTLRIEKALLEEVKRQADKNKRSITKQIELLIEQALDKVQ